MIPKLFDWSLFVGKRSDGKREDSPNQSILCKIFFRVQKKARAEKTGQSLPRLLAVTRGSFLKVLKTHQTICFPNSFHEIERFMAIMNRFNKKLLFLLFYLRNGWNLWNPEQPFYASWVHDRSAMTRQLVELTYQTDWLTYF